MSITTIAHDADEPAVDDEYTTETTTTTDADPKGKRGHKSSKSKSHSRSEHDSRAEHYEQGYAPSHIGTIDEHNEYQQMDNTQNPSTLNRSYHDQTYTYSEQTSAPYGYYDEHDAPSASYHQDNAQHRPSDELDQRYNVEHSSRFRAGEIFKVYWSEPKGARRMPSLSGREEQVNKLGQLVHTGFRRFIVIANDQGHCTCVPILTYENKACTKSGVKPEKHGIIFDERKRPHTLHREPDLGFKPIRATMTEPLETLAKESRVNYSKPSTIEHNSLVWFIGRVHPDDFHIVSRAYNKCWAKKDARHRRN